jgi:hypothetical protein
LPLHDELVMRFSVWRDITCDGSVMAETAEFRQCDGVMDSITHIFCTSSGCAAELGRDR